MTPEQGKFIKAVKERMRYGFNNADGEMLMEIIGTLEEDIDIRDEIIKAKDEIIKGLENKK